MMIATSVYGASGLDRQEYVQVIELRICSAQQVTNGG